MGPSFPDAMPGCQARYAMVPSPPPPQEKSGTGISAVGELRDAPPDTENHRRFTGIFNVSVRFLRNNFSSRWFDVCLS
jgi:hypothetical protein